MCIFPKAPSPASPIVANPDAPVRAAADAVMRDRRSAKGFSASILGGLDPNAANPSLARQMLLGA